MHVETYSVTSGRTRITFLSDHSDRSIVCSIFDIDRVTRDPCRNTFTIRRKPPLSAVTVSGKGQQAAYTALKHLIRDFFSGMHMEGAGEIPATDREQWRCAICLEGAARRESPDPLVRLGCCGQCLHRACALKIVAQGAGGCHPSCPLCRSRTCPIFGELPRAPRVL